MASGMMIFLRPKALATMEGLYVASLDSQDVGH